MDIIHGPWRDPGDNIAIVDNPKSPVLEKSIIVIRKRLIADPWLAIRVHTLNLNPGQPKPGRTQSSQNKETLRRVCEQYLDSERFNSLSKYTKKEYRLYSNRILNKELTDNSLFGETLINDITPGVIRSYLDSRSDAKVTANREIAYLSTAFSWAYECDLVAFNPVKGVKKYTEKARSLYVTDELYDYFYNLAESPWYIRPMMEIAYLCRMRRAEILDLKKSDILPEGLDTRRRKGSKDAITEWTPRLRVAIDVCLNRKTKIKSIYLFTNDSGQPIADGTFTTVWGRLWRTKADKESIRFTFHDFKSQGRE